MMLQADDFWKRVAIGEPNECWLWSLSTINGYGRFREDGRTVRAHRRAWELTYGPIPPGLDACHSCDVRYAIDDWTGRRCCNPAHLFLGTRAENLADMRAKGRQASGERHGAHTHPERVARGDRHPSRLHPERLRRGAAHHFRVNPALILHGEAVPTHKLTADDVYAIRRACAAGQRRRLVAQHFGVNVRTVSAIMLRETWAHLP